MASPKFTPKERGILKAVVLQATFSGSLIPEITTLLEKLMDATELEDYIEGRLKQYTTKLAAIKNQKHPRKRAGKKVKR